MKKIISVFMVLILFSICCTTTAETATYSSTRSFISRLNEAGIVYSLKGVDSDGDEHVTVGNRSDVCTIMIHYFFDGQYVIIIRVWNIIDFNSYDYDQVARLCDKLNAKYNFVKFYVDKSDYSVTASFDLVSYSSDCGDSVMLATIKLVQIIDDAYPSLAIYAK